MGSPAEMHASNGSPSPYASDLRTPSGHLGTLQPLPVIASGAGSMLLSRLALCSPLLGLEVGGRSKSGVGASRGSEQVGLEQVGASSGTRDSRLETRDLRLET